MNKIIAIIPARLASKRFPRKVICDLDGMSMIERVYRAGKSCDFIDEVVVASDSQEVIDHVEKFQGIAILTSDKHKSGTERIAELIDRYDDYNVFINLQGDQPFVTSAMLKSLVIPYLEGLSPNMTTLACPLSDMEELNNPNTVKVLLDQNSNAIYFSRSPIPFIKINVKPLPVYHHLGLYAFTRDFLKTYVLLAPTPFEQCESLEQLRVIENGYKIQVQLTDKYVPEINTPGDILLAKKLNFI